MRRSKETIENPIRDGETSEARLLAAIAAERELMILDSPSGKREYIQTGKNAEALVQLLKSKRMQLIRSKTLTGPYYLGLFDYQGNLRILVCRAKSVPPGDCPYKLNINGKEVVSEYIEKVKIVYGAPAVICVCTTQ